MADRKGVRLDPEQAQAAQEKMGELLRRSAVDTEFRQKLLTEPRTALAEFAGKSVAELPPDLDVVFVENRGAQTIVLPDPVDPAETLSDEELEAVAGGSPITITVTVVTVTTVWL